MKYYEEMSLADHKFYTCEFVEDFYLEDFGISFKKGDLRKVKDFGDEWFELIGAPFDYVTYPKNMLRPI